MNNNVAIRPCHPSQSMLLALILPRGDQLYELRRHLIRRDNGDTLSLLVLFLLKPWVPCAPPLLPCDSLYHRVWQLLNKPFLVYVFPFPPKSPLFPTWRLQFLCGFLRFFASLPPPPILPSFPSPFSSPLLLLSSVLALVPVPILSLSTGLHPRPRSRPRPAPAPVLIPILHSSIRIHPSSRSRSHSVPVPITVHVPILAPDPVTASVPAPDPVHSFLSLGPGYPLDAMRVYRHRISRTELSDARKCHPLSAEMMPRAEQKCLIASTVLVQFLALLYSCVSWSPRACHYGTLHEPTTVSDSLDRLVKDQSHRPPEFVYGYAYQDGKWEYRGDYAQEADHVRRICGGHGRHEVAKVCDVQRTGGGTGCVWGQKKGRRGCLLDDLKDFGINADQRTAAAQDKGECRKATEQGVARFMAKLVAAKKARTGLRYAVVCPNVTGRTKEMIVQSKRARSGSVAIVD